jgi:deoxyribonuclease IV
MSRIGLHVSAAGGADNAPDNAKAAGCEVFQFFSRSPRGGGAPPISDATADAFQKKCKAYGMNSYIHAPYYINFASSHHRISWGSVGALQEELRRGTQLGVTYVMTHLGSRKDLGQTAAVKQTIARITAIYEKNERWTTRLLLEISAGATDVIGDTFEELSAVWRGVGRPDVGICLDTCHLFASGYDIRTPATITDTVNAFKKHLPLSTFKLVHANDSTFGLKEHRDRHADIGDGELGAVTFRHLLAHLAFRGRDFILETPGEEPRRKKDVALLKKLRGSR